MFQKKKKLDYFGSRSATKVLRTIRRRYPNDTDIRRLSARQLYSLLHDSRKLGQLQTNAMIMLEDQDLAGVLKMFKS